MGSRDNGARVRSLGEAKGCKEWLLGRTQELLVKKSFPPHNSTASIFHPIKPCSLNISTSWLFGCSSSLESEFVLQLIVLEVSGVLREDFH